ncbi:MAG: hypothetical protein ABFS86_17645 [Planctomycetota bacterium]
MTDRRRDRSTVRVEAIRKQLETIAREGDFEYVAVADELGFVLGEAGGGHFLCAADVERFRRVLTKFKELLVDHMDLHQVAETRVVRLDDRRLLCRFFEFGDQELSVLTVTKGRDPDADLLDRTVAGVTRILNGYDL